MRSCVRRVAPCRRANQAAHPVASSTQVARIRSVPCARCCSITVNPSSASSTATTRVAVHSDAPVSCARVRSIISKRGRSICHAGPMGLRMKSLYPGLFRPHSDMLPGQRQCPSARKTSDRPRRCSASRMSGGTLSPKRSTGSAPASVTTTSSPVVCRRPIDAAKPAGPPPMTRTSHRGAIRRPSARACAGRGLVGVERPVGHHIDRLPRGW